MPELIEMVLPRVGATIVENVYDLPTNNPAGPMSTDNKSVMIFGSGTSYHHRRRTNGGDTFADDARRYARTYGCDVLAVEWILDSIAAYCVIEQRAPYSIYDTTAT